MGHALRLLPDFSPQNLSNTAWALATLKEFEPVRLLHRVRPQAHPACRPSGAAVLHTACRPSMVAVSWLFSL